MRAAAAAVMAVRERERGRKRERERESNQMAHERDTRAPVKMWTVQLHRTPNREIRVIEETRARLQIRMQLREEKRERDDRVSGNQG